MVRPPIGDTPSRQGRGVPYLYLCLYKGLYVREYCQALRRATGSFGFLKKGFWDFRENGKARRMRASNDRQGLQAPRFTQEMDHHQTMALHGLRRNVFDPPNGPQPKSFRHEPQKLRHEPARAQAPKKS